MQNEIKHTRFFNQSPQKVWEYLTNPELLEQWLGKTDLLPIVGHKFRFISPYGNDSYCEVLEAKPYTKLSYSWQKKSAKDLQPFNSIVVWTLVPKENGTELQLVHNGFTAMEDLAGHDNGWDDCLKKFEERVNILNGNKSFTATIEVASSPEDVFHRINDVSKWWSKDFEGSSTKLNDEFVICHPGAHYTKQQLIEVVPGKKVVWLVTDSNLSWLEKDKHEWTTTKMVFEITSKGDKTVLHFTHEGLVPGKECYARCQEGWSMVLKEGLFNFITAGKGL